MTISGGAGYLRLWIPGFVEIAQPLYSATVGDQPLKWTQTEDRAFQKLKQTPTWALALPGVIKPFPFLLVK